MSEMIIDAQIDRVIYTSKDYYCASVITLSGEKAVVNGNVGPLTGIYVNLRETPVRFHGAFRKHPKYGQQFHFKLISLAPSASPKDYVDLLTTPYTKKAQMLEPIRHLDKWSAEAYSSVSKVIKELYSPPIAKGHLDALVRHSYWTVAVNKMSGVKGVQFQTLEESFVSLPVGRIKEILDAPYRMCIERIIDFKVASVLAGPTHTEERQVAAIISLVESYCKSEKSTCAPVAAILPKLSKLTGFDNLPDTPDFSIHSRDESDLLQSRMYRDTELGIARRIKALSATPSSYCITSDNIEHVVNAEGKEATSCQHKAFHISENPICLITGLPGTGKTFFIDVLVKAVKEFTQANVLLIGPTGTSAMRLEEMCNEEAQTIHSALAYNPGTKKFLHDENNPLDADWVIVDEVSMTDTFLFYSLLKAVPDTANLVLLGDIDQLASIGEGAVIRDLFECIPSVRMETTRRFVEGGIIKFCHALCSGKIDYELKSNDIKIHITPSLETLQSWVFQAVEKILITAKRAGMSQVQIMAPEYAGEVGIDAINEFCRKVLFPDVSPVEIQVGEKTYRHHQGSKVLIKKNMPLKKVFNGDVGMIVKFSGGEEDFVQVSIRNRIVSLSMQEAKNMIPGYCISIHNAQGQEYPYALTIVTKKTSKILSRNLINSAVSRGKRTVIVVAEDGALEMCANKTERNRMTLLQEHIAAEVSQLFSPRQANQSTL